MSDDDQPTTSLHFDLAMTTAAAVADAVLEALGALLQARGYKVRLRKLDPYLNVDPGTMSPFQHGEVYVTDDGAETDLDLGHYYRYTSSPLSALSNVTSGQVYHTVIRHERRGDYLGKTVQVIPHITDEIKQRIIQAGKSAENTDVLLVEIGGTVGDIESLPFLEAARQVRHDPAPAREPDHALELPLVRLPVDRHLEFRPDRNVRVHERRVGLLHLELGGDVGAHEQVGRLGTANRDIGLSRRSKTGRDDQSEQDGTDELRNRGHGPSLIIAGLVSQT